MRYTCIYITLAHDCNRSQVPPGAKDDGAKMRIKLFFYFSLHFGVSL